MSSTANSSPAPTTAAPPADIEPLVLFREQYAARIYTLNRPKSFNALNHEMVNMLQKQIKAWNESELCSSIIGTGKGHFCAGGDVKTLVTLIQDESTRDQAIAFFRDEFMLDFQLSQLRKPYVVIMDGITMGGGVGLSMHAPFRVATERTQFAMPETDIGYFTDVGATHFLAHLDGQLGTYLGLSSARVTGRAVFECGIATHYVPSRNIPLLLERLSRLEDADYNVIDQAIDEFYEHRTSGGGTHDDPPPLLVGDVRVAIDQAFSPQDPIKIMQNLESLSQGQPIASARPTTPAQKKQSSGANSSTHGTPSSTTSEVQPTPPVSTAVAAWATETFKAIQERSPTGVCVTREAIWQAREKTLQSAFETEMGLAKAFCTTLAGDFVEGVRAKLIRKGEDGPPKWNPEGLLKVDREMVRGLVASAGQEGKAVEGFTLETDPSAGRDQSSYGLPSEEMIRTIVMGDKRKRKGTGKSGTKRGQTGEEIVEQVVKAFKAKHGVRERVQEVLTRRTRVVQSGAGPGVVEWIDS